MKVTLAYGADSTTKNIPAGSSVSVLASRNNLALLGAPTENPRLTVDGCEVSPNYTLSEGDTVYVEARAHSKA